jgi:hypothetical protein
MKYLILFLSFNVFAMTNYVPEDKSIGAFSNKETCEKISNKECYPFNVQTDNPEIMLVKEIEVNDYSRPIYATKTDVTPCKIYKDYIDPTTEEVQKDDCRLLVAYDEKEPTLCTDKTYYPLYAEKEKDVYEAYCTKLLGYEQKIEKRLLEDATLKAAKDAEKAQLEAQEALKQQNIEAAKQALKTAKGNVESLSQRDLAALIEKIILLLE